MPGRRAGARICSVPGQPLDNPSPLSFLFGPGPTGNRGSLWPRWIFLRALGVIFFSVFYSLAFQIKGLIGLDGLLPAAAYLIMSRSALPLLSIQKWILEPAMHGDK